MKVCVIAPYAPAERAGLVSLGAAMKLNALISGLKENHQSVLLINSAHQAEIWSFPVVRRCKALCQVVAEIEPLRINSRALGKALQSSYAVFLGIRIQLRWRPDIIWIYNAYLFETLFLIGAKLVSPNARFVLELEDMPMARKRSGIGGIKTWLDNLGFHLVKRLVNDITIVNRGMEMYVSSSKRRVWYLPILLPAVTSQPRRRGKKLKVGYFGGLYRDKGMGRLMEIIRRTGAFCQWDVGGSGDAEFEIGKLAEACGQFMKFHGVLSQSEFRRIYDQLDVVINLHGPLELYGNGIFPYKLLEGVAHQKCVVSTKMTGCPAEVSEAIFWLENDVVESAIRILQDLAHGSQSRAEKRELASTWVKENFTGKMFIEKFLQGAAAGG